MLQLFGPKWSYNMPKYAANLSVAPLQPQKQITPSSSTHAEANNYDKNIPKAANWTDPFASNGQECELKYLIQKKCNKFKCENYVLFENKTTIFTY